MSRSDIRIHLDLSDQINGQSMSLHHNTGVSAPEVMGSESPNNSPQTQSQPQSQSLAPPTQKANRRRSNSQSQVVLTPSLGLNDLSTSSREMAPPKRKQVQYFVTLVSLNDTFVTKHLSVPYFPETRKLGRPSGAKIKPDVTNGFFDSRVLSRNHAIMYVDPNNGKLMLKDLGSSNGTFVNNKKLDTEPAEIKLGDNICFGFNIQVGINHKQINCKVENINIMSDLISKDSALVNADSMDSIEYQFYRYVQDLYNKVSVQNRKTELNESSKKPPLNFETALFGDINPDIEDDLLGLYAKADNGIFKNSGTTTSSKLEDSMNLLINCFTKLKQQNHSLNSIETFLTDYSTRVNDLNNQYLTHQMDVKFSDLNKKIDKEKSNNDKLMKEYEQLRNENFKKIKKLEEKVYNLKSDKSKLTKKVDYLNLKVDSHGELHDIDIPKSNSLGKLSSLNESKLSLNDLDDQIEENSVENSSEDSKKEDPLTQLLTNSLQGLNSLDSSGKTKSVERKKDQTQGQNQNGHSQSQNQSQGQNGQDGQNRQNQNQNGTKESTDDSSQVSPPIINDLPIDSSPESESELDLSPKVSNSTTASSVTSFDRENDINTDLRYNQNNFVFIAIISVIMGFIVSHTFYE